MDLSRIWSQTRVRDQVHNKFVRVIADFWVHSRPGHQHLSWHVEIETASRGPGRGLFKILLTDI